MNRFQEMANAGARAEPEPVAVNPFREGAEQIAADRAAKKWDVDLAAYLNPEPVKNRRGGKYGRLRITRHEKLGYGHWSHTVEGQQVADIENVNAKLRELSGLDFAVDKSEPRKLNYLTRREMERAYEAIMRLHCMGLNFNIWYTCTWRSVELTTDEQVAEAIEDHIEHLRHWMKDEALKVHEEPEIHYIWVVERGRKRGLHMHVLLHLPKKIPLRKFEREVSQSIFTITGMYPRCPAPKPAKRIKQIKRSKSAVPSANPFVDVPIEPIEVDEDDTRTVHIDRLTSVGEQWLLFRYLMKGLDPEEEMHVYGDLHRRRKCSPLTRYLGLERVSHEGRYLGLRFGRSRTLCLEAWNEFKAGQKMPPNPLETAKSSEVLYGRQFLDFAKASGHPKPKSGGVKLLRSLEI